MNFTTKRLRDTRLNEQFADASQLVSVLDSIDNKLSDITMDDDYTQLSNICIVLNQIIEKFGGKPATTGNIVLRVKITQDDIDKNNNVVFFTQDPMLLQNDDTPQIDWGD